MVLLAKSKSGSNDVLPPGFKVGRLDLGAFIQGSQSGHEAAFTSGGIVLMYGAFRSRFIERFYGSVCSFPGAFQILFFDGKKSLLNQSSCPALIGTVLRSAFDILSFSFL